MSKEDIKIGKSIVRVLMILFTGFGTIGLIGFCLVVSLSDDYLMGIKLLTVSVLSYVITYRLADNIRGIEC